MFRRFGRIRTDSDGFGGTGPRGAWGASRVRGGRGVRGARARRGVRGAAAADQSRAQFLLSDCPYSDGNCTLEARPRAGRASRGAGTGGAASRGAGPGGTGGAAASREPRPAAVTA